MDELLLVLEFPIDFKGQQLASDYSGLILNFAIFISVFVGFITQKIEFVVYTFGGCLFGLFLIVLPNWPIFNKDPVQWLQLNYFTDDATATDL